MPKTSALMLCFAGTHQSSISSDTAAEGVLRHDSPAAHPQAQASLRWAAAGRCTLSWHTLRPCRYLGRSHTCLFQGISCQATHDLVPAGLCLTSPVLSEGVSPKWVSKRTWCLAQGTASGLKAAAAEAAAAAEHCPASGWHFPGAAGGAAGRRRPSGAGLGVLDTRTSPCFRDSDSRPRGGAAASATQHRGPDGAPAQHGCASATTLTRGRASAAPATCGRASAARPTRDFTAAIAALSCCRCRGLLSLQLLQLSAPPHSRCCRRCTSSTAGDFTPWACSALDVLPKFEKSDIESCRHCKRSDVCICRDVRRRGVDGEGGVASNGARRRLGAAAGPGEDDGELAAGPHPSPSGPCPPPGSRCGPPTRAAGALRFVVRRRSCMQT